MRFVAEIPRNAVTFVEAMNPHRTEAEPACRQRALTHLGSPAMINGDDDDVAIAVGYPSIMFTFASTPCETRRGCTPSPASCCSDHGCLQKEPSKGKKITLIN